LGQEGIGHLGEPFDRLAVGGDHGGGHASVPRAERAGRMSRIGHSQGRAFVLRHDAHLGGDVD
jgi:hypothetical protein